MPVTYTNHNGEKVVSHVGCVLHTAHQSWYDDWDELVVVWNPDTKKPESVIVYSTRFGTGDTSFTIDATDEVLAEYNAYLRELKYNKLKSEAYEYAHKIRKGSEVVVVKGRKVKHGTKGLVFWEGTKRFGYSVVRTLGIAVNGEKDEHGKFKEVVWVSADNCEVADPDMPNDYEILANAFNHHPMVKGY